MMNYLTNNHNLLIIYYQLNNIYFILLIKII